MLQLREAFVPPSCSTKDSMETDEPNNQCKNCGLKFEEDRENYAYIVDEQDVEHVKEFGRK